MKIDASLTTVRRRTDADLDACVDLLREVYEHDGYPVSRPERPAAWITPPTTVGAWVAERGGRPVGHVGPAGPREHDAAPGVWSAATGRDVGQAVMVNRLYVPPAARGHGLGAPLLAEAVAEAGVLGRRAVLDVAAHDTAATALYERLRWHRTAAVAQEWGPHGTVAVHCCATPGAHPPHPVRHPR
ncbi:MULTISPECIES: GNAT family N-acetyltransferase [Streptomyces]|uniref:GNAT family N-acetyltransferase n=2 Tax=Streptomyces TaxID=1883 RepID=A0ABU4K9P9_9ACTN|nr:GNAT family N-acetyltransferase [Streptomyces roseolus]MDX2294476.1 GNAT family N-acetyltransferase [Streptomyces roseolus]